jgi:quercetin dioxygenase-like cupin family protein
MYTIHESDVELKKLVGRAYKLLFGSDVLGCKNLCGGVSFFPPRRHAPGHVHDKAEEIIYVVKGHGELVIGKKKERIRPGSFGYIRKGVLHSINNTGTSTIKLVYVFSPPVRVGKYKNIKHN